MAEFLDKIWEIQAFFIRHIFRAKVSRCNMFPSDGISTYCKACLTCYLVPKVCANEMQDIQDIQGVILELKPNGV